MQKEKEMVIKKNREEEIKREKEHLWNLPYNVKIKLDPDEKN
jgi:hypothetical protein